MCHVSLNKRLVGRLDHFRKINQLTLFGLISSPHMASLVVSRHDIRRQLVIRNHRRKSPLFQSHGMNSRRNSKRRGMKLHLMLRRNSISSLYRRVQQLYSIWFLIPLLSTCPQGEFLIFEILFLCNLSTHLVVICPESETTCDVCVRGTTKKSNLSELIQLHLLLLSFDEWLRIR